MPFSALKHATDAFRMSAREEFRRLQAYFRGQSRCDHCRKRLLYDGYGDPNHHQGWRVAVLPGESGRPGEKRDVPVCYECGNSPRYSAA